MKRAWLALLCCACGSVPSYIADGKYPEACLLAREHRDPSEDALVQAAVKGSVEIDLSAEPMSPPEGVLLPVGIRMVRFRAAIRRLPRRGLLQLGIPYTEDTRLYYAPARAEDFAPIEGEPIEVPALYERPEYEPERPQPRLHYVSEQEPLSRRVDNAVRGWLSVFTLGAVRQHPRARHLTPASLRALERWRAQNQAHYADWDQEQSRLEQANRESRRQAQEHNQALEARREAHAQTVEESVRFYRSLIRPRWEHCDSMGGDGLMDEEGRCELRAAVPVDAPLPQIYLSSELALHDESYRFCRVPLRWNAGSHPNIESVLSAYATPTALTP